MKLLAAIITIGSLLIAPQIALGHTDHSHEKAKPASEDALVSQAEKEIKGLIKKGKLDPSWATAAKSSLTKKQNGKKMEWLLTYENKKITDEKKNKLFLFFTYAGKFLAANHTGK